MSCARLAGVRSTPGRWVVTQIPLRSKVEEREDDHLSVEPVCRDDLGAQCKSGEIDGQSGP
jgi:hypothetical protein